jgi:hypothetical protein
MYQPDILKQDLDGNGQLISSIEYHPIMKAESTFWIESP